MNLNFINLSTNNSSSFPLNFVYEKKQIKNPVNHFFRSSMRHWSSQQLNFSLIAFFNLHVNNRDRFTALWYSSQRGHERNFKSRPASIFKIRGLQKCFLSRFHVRTQLWSYCWGLSLIPYHHWVQISKEKINFSKLICNPAGLPTVQVQYLTRNWWPFGVSNHSRKEPDRKLRYEIARHLIPLNDTTFPTHSLLPLPLCCSFNR